MKGILIIIGVVLWLASITPAHAELELRPPSNHPNLDEVMNFLTDSASPESAAGLTAGMLLLGRSKEFVVAQKMFMAVVVSAGITGGLKLAINRQRPAGETTRHNSSFPSGHATGSFAMATVMASEYPRAAPLFWLWAGSVSYSRVYKSRHYPVDIVAGAVIGIGIARLALRHADRYVMKGKGLLGFVFGEEETEISISIRF